MADTTTVDIEHPPLTEAEIAFFHAEMAKLVTEDDAPVDNIFSEKQQRLLTETVYSSWNAEGRSFVAMANVGLFYTMVRPPLVPDVLLSLDVQLPEEVWSKHHRAYFTWIYEKPPEIVIEIVSNRAGGELDHKRSLYAQIGVLYYVVLDPGQALKRGVLQVFELLRRSYVERDNAWFPEISLGLTLWSGEYEGHRADWLRWCYEDGTLVPTGAERAEQERARAERSTQQAEREYARAEQEHARAERSTQQAEQERARAERMAAQLRALGIEPEE
jgi:Uma2 family endonuclease